MYSIFTKHLLAVGLAIGISSAVQAQARKFDSLLSAYHTQHQFSGVALLSINGHIKYCKAIGLANRATGTPITHTDKFRIASITKTFTALMIMKLVEEGKIDLNQTIGHYYPAYSGPARNVVTIHQLLTYSSGIYNALQQQQLLPYQSPTSLQQFIHTYCSGPLIDTPGTKSQYANTEYIILHQIIEQVSGLSYANYLKKTILQPLHLHHTGIATTSHTPTPWLAAYTYSDSLHTYSPDPFYLPEMYFGAGCLYSTITDLHTLDQAIFNHKILSTSTTQQLLRIHPQLGYTAYSFWGSSGWGTFSEPFYYRTGGIQGSTANWIHTMNSKKTIIILSNTNATNLYQLSEALYQLH